MEKIFPLLKKILEAAIAFVAFSLGVKQQELEQNIAQRDAALKAANEALENAKSYETLKNLAPSSWDNTKRLPNDTQNKVSAPVQTK